VLVLPVLVLPVLAVPVLVLPVLAVLVLVVIPVVVMAARSELAVLFNQLTRLGIVAAEPVDPPVKDDTTGNATFVRLVRSVLLVNSSHMLFISELVLDEEGKFIIVGSTALSIDATSRGCEASNAVVVAVVGWLGSLDVEVDVSPDVPSELPADASSNCHAHSPVHASSVVILRHAKSCPKFATVGQHPYILGAPEERSFTYAILPSTVVRLYTAQHRTRVEGHTSVMSARILMVLGSKSLRVWSPRLQWEVDLDYQQADCTQALRL
jgi:hypothetical protein